MNNQEITLDIGIRPEANNIRFTFSTGTLLSDDLFYVRTRHGCFQKVKLCFCVIDSWTGSKWQLPPLSLRKLAQLVTDITAPNKDAKLSFRRKTLVTDLANLLENLHERHLHKTRNRADQIAQMLTAIAKDPDAGHMPCVLDLLGLAPIPKDGDQSATFDENHQRLSIREGHCVLASRNWSMVCCRRVVIWLSVVCSTCGLIGVMTPLVSKEWYMLVVWIALGLLLCCITTLLFNSPFCKGTPLCGITSHFKIWLRVSDDSVSFFYDHTNAADGYPPQAVLLLLPGFEIIHAEQGCVSCFTRCSLCLPQYSFTIRTIDEEWELTFTSALERDLWIDALEEALRKQGLLHDPVEQFLKDAVPVNQSQDAFAMGSFAPIQPDCLATWFVDGHGYFKSCKAAMLQAQKSIYITDWMLSAEVLLERPSPEELEIAGRSLEPQEGGKDYSETLADLLLVKAKQGVQVRVMIFKELTISLPNDSKHAAKQLVKHENIKVLRHEQGTEILWSHHEKLCIIDHNISYIGGIDLAFGRYDTPAHPIKDDMCRFVPGKDLYNPRVAGQADVNKPHDDLFDRKILPRMPWHDITFCVSGSAARDAAKHFLQRWDNHEKSQDFESAADLAGDYENFRDYDGDITVDRSRDFCYCSSKYTKCCGYCFTTTRESCSCCERQYKVIPNEVLMLDAHVAPAVPIPGMAQLWESFPVQAQVLRSASDWSIGHVDIHDGDWFENSIYQAYLHEIMNAERYIHIENQFFISSTANSSTLMSDTAKQDNTVMHFVHNLESVLDDAIGTDHINNRIADALVRRIEKAILAKKAFEKYELGGKQGTEPSDDGTFRVVVMIPNFPEGAVTDVSVAVVLHYTLMTLNGVEVPKGFNSGADAKAAVMGSLIKRVQRSCFEHLGDADRWTEYISVNCLRNHAVFDNGIPVMNQIYVHAKLMIVDDRVAICGSANINERSQSGNRDSEVCYRILPSQGKGDIEILMNGKPHQASSFAHSLRRSLWAEHLGELDVLQAKADGDAVPEEASESGCGQPHSNLQEPCRFINDKLGDPVCNDNYNLWLQTAKENTRVCNKYFIEQPANHHSTLSIYAICREIVDHEIQNEQTKMDDAVCELAKMQMKADEQNKLVFHPLAERVEALKTLKGHLYEYPIDFLHNDLLAGKLKPAIGTAEAVLPAKTFT